MRTQTGNLFPILIMCLLPMACSAQQIEESEARPQACAAAEHRQFDFWLGEWNVYTQDGKLVGHNSIQRRHNGCVLHENYKTLGSYTGESLNTFDASRQLWHQTWTDSSGGLLLLEGGMQDGSMVLQGQTKNAEGETIENRISWTVNSDGSVRQWWQIRTEGAQWSDAFDGVYRRKE